MYFTQHEIAQSRDYTLNNLLGLSAACLNAGHRLAELFSSAGRDALHSGSKHVAQLGHGQLDALTQLPATLWLEHRSRTSKLVDNAYEIVGETHKMLVHSAEAQVRMIDEIAVSSLQRLEKNRPWEAGIAIQAETQPTGENLSEATSAKSKPAPRRRSNAN